MSINDLFCTPEQGRRLAELVPDLTSAFVWGRTNPNGSFEKHPLLYDDFPTSFRGVFMPLDLELDVLLDFARKKNLIVPALTLQELRDVANQYPDIAYKTSFYTAMSHMTAPELAAWVIQRLEDTP